jgi:hypothetical protein
MDFGSNFAVFGNSSGQGMGSMHTNAAMGGNAMPGGGISGGGTYGGGDAGAIKALQASTANYQQQFKARYDKLMGLASQFGAAQQQQNADLLRQQSAQGQNSLVSRGLGNSTVVNAVQQNAQNQAQLRNAQSADEVTKMQMGATQDIQPQAPNYQMYASMLSQPHTGSYAGLLKAQPKFNLFG